MNQLLHPTDGDGNNNSIVSPLLRTNYQSRHFLMSLHRLRGVAILFIVAIHCTYFFDWKLHPAVRDFFNDFFDNSTMLFVFISGFLFQHLLRSFTYSRYLINKILYVVLPYLVASAPAIVYMLISGDAVKDYAELRGHSVVYEIGWFLINGGAHINYALWFMPVIFIYYIASPLFRFIQRHPYLYISLGLLLPLSMLEHRPTYAHGHDLSLALYFLPIYMLGMFVSQYRQYFEQLLAKRWTLVLAIYAGILLGHFALSSHHGKYTGENMFTFSQGLIDWIFLQQIFMIFSAYALVKRLDKMQLRWLDFVAEVSFGIYFVHVYLLILFKHITRHQIFEGNVLDVALLLLLTVSISCLLVFSARVILGKYSRLALGC